MSIIATDSVTVTKLPDVGMIKSEIYKHGDVTMSVGYGGNMTLSTSRYNPIVLPDGRTRQIIKETISPKRYREKTIARTRLSVHTKPNSVTIVNRQMVTGLNKHSGKRYYRWETTALHSLFKTSRGNFNVISRAGSKRGLDFVHTENKMSFFRAVSSSKSAIIDDAMKMVFGKVITPSDIYPSLKVLNDSASYLWLSHVPPELLKNDDPRKFISYVFGGYNKNILRALKSAVSAQTAVAIGKLDIPLDWKASLVAEKGGWGMWYSNPDDMNKVMAVLDANQRKSIFNKMLKSDTVEVSFDAFRTLRQLLDRNADISSIIKLPTMQKIHDDAWKTLDDLKHKNVTIDCWDNPELNMGIGNVDWYLASDTHEIRNWGNRFNHCIGSYANSVSEDNIFGIIRRDGKEIGNFQISNGVLQQFYGTNNMKVSDIDLGAHNTFVTHLKDAGYSAGFWRQTDRVDADAYGW